MEVRVRPGRNFLKPRLGRASSERMTVTETPRGRDQPCKVQWESVQKDGSTWVPFL